MFTDIAGYSALMSRDESLAMSILEKNRNLHKEAISKFNGEYIKEIGDGTLAIFHSSFDAVNCAFEIQKACCTEHSLKVRIGIHTGDIIESDGNVFGDGVNVASRIEAAGEPGGIYISEKAYDDIKNKTGIRAEFYGEKNLKNIPDAVRIYSIFPGRKESELAEPVLTDHSKSKERSIAVLPFVDMSPEKEQDSCFCDGITEEIINALAHVESFKVIARTSAFVFRNKQADIREIGRILDVETLLEGSIQKIGNRLRITAQLIKVADGSHIWAERFDREMKDVFDIQDEISLAILDNMKVKLLGETKAMITKRHSENLEAYNLYLKGAYYWQMLTMKGFKKAIEFFELALKKDPDYALAYIGLAAVNISSAFWGNVIPNKAFLKANENLSKALNIDSTLAEAYCELGKICTFYYWNWKEAERNFKHALQINQNQAFFHISYSFLLTFTGRHKEAISEAQRAKELDPLSPFINTHAGIAYAYADQPEMAIEEYHATLTINPNYFFAYFHLGKVYSEKSMFIEAIAALEKAVELSNENPFATAFLACNYYLIGKVDQADKILDSLKKRTEIEYVPAISFYLIHRVRGEEDLALEWLEKACDEHDTFLPWLKANPVYFPEGSKYKLLLQEVGL
ncbi:MAG: adenylate/guanylate cyclase domain-containing protein [Bacteroidales bacterium]|nr:hypothetical protein [Lentimicrobiaceae bacterium]MDD5694209.1 adenylate/guanylate cyclase domain-containing protein [Bacteroidales bacterium]